MRKLWKMIENALAAAAFAEEGEAEMARELLAEDGREATAGAGRTPARGAAPRRDLPRQKIARLP